MSTGNESEEEEVAAAAAATEREATLMAEAVAVAYQSEDEAQEQAAAQEQQEGAAGEAAEGNQEGAEHEGEAEAMSEGGENAENESNDNSNPGEGGGNPEETAAADRRQATKRELTAIIDKWEQQQTQNGYDPIPTLRSLAEIFEREKDVYRRKDPDPLDTRHPYRADPSCQYGLLLKLLFRKDAFMSKLLCDYLRENYFSRQGVSRSSLELNILACRLILELMPGLETTVVFQTADDDGTINRIYSWAEDSIEPLQSYATGLLADAMDVSDITVNYRDQNMRLVPKMIKRLHMLLAISKSSATSSEANNTSLLHNQSSADSSTASASMFSWVDCPNNPSAPQSPRQHNGSGGVGGAAGGGGVPGVHADTSNMSILFENSRDAFPVSRYYKRMYIPMHPATADTSQMLIMRYLTSLGEYQEYLAMAFENNVMQLIFGYLENLDRRDTCLAYEVLKYLASLLCHKKFALEFIAHGGLELLLKVPRPSLATTGVSIAIYYLAYCEDAMERICTMQRPLISELVRYALWILGRCHDSSKCHATMFFSLSFQFKVILDEFDAQDGLRKLYNVISVLKILDPSHNDSDNDSEINEDQECASRQMVRHVCVALKRYMEAHFFYKYNSFLCQHYAASSSHFFSQNPTVAAKLTFDQLHDQIRTLQEHTSIRAQWGPVDQLMKLGGITMLLRIIAFSYDWMNTGRSETVRSALDVLSVCCIIPRVYVVLCERLTMLDKTTTSGFCSVLGAAAGEITTDAEVLKSALAVLCHCVCSPIIRNPDSSSSASSRLIKFGNSSRKNKANNKYAEELIERVWESVCSNNGIVVLLSLMQTKGPITDADCIRGMACRALAGLARSDRVRQIVSKLPLFASGQLQTLMRDPILQEKRAEHVIFQKYALELLERVSGKTKTLNNPLDPSLSNMHKANVIAQTRIQYNKQQLYQLIYEHLESDGLSQTAQMLQREVGLPLQTPTTRNFHQSPFDYKTLPSGGSNSLSRSRLRSRMQDVNAAIMASGEPVNRSFSEDPLLAAVGAGTGAGAGAGTGAVDGPSGSSGIPNFGCLSASIQTPPIKIRKTERHPSISSSVNRSLAIQKHMMEPGGMAMGLPDDLASQSHPNRVTLNTIVTEYLTNQHSLCNNPVITCPQFDLYEPHKCPDPRPSRLMSSNYNLTSRHARTQAGFNTSRFDRRYVHTHFSPWRTIRSADYEDLEFTCCDLVGKYIIVGTQQGDGRVFNLNNGVEQFFSNCHNFSVDAIKANRAGDLVITSSFWRIPTSILWSIADNEFKLKLRLPDVTYCEFSQTSQDRLLGTQNECATLYDINTGSKVSTFTPTIPNLYTKNRATLCRTDELILSDGVLWDVRSGKEIHKFDKFNQCISGVFHPNCLEIIANTEVWDLRTFHLLQTVPVLDQRNCTFSPMHVIYGAGLGADRDHDSETTTYDTSFNVLDAYDYSSIATIDVKRNINDLSVSANGGLIAVVEDYSGYESKQETYVKIYAVGVKKGERSEEEDDEEVPESDEDGSDTGSETFTIGPDFMGFPMLRRNHNNGNGNDDVEEDDDDDDGDLDLDDDDGDLLVDDDDGESDADTEDDAEDDVFDYFANADSSSDD